MSELVEYSLSDIASVQTGPFGSQLHMADYVFDGTPIITVEHFGENRVIHKNLPLVSKDDRQRLIKYTLQEGDVVFSRVGSVDRRVYVTEKENGWMFSGRCLRVRCNPEIVNGKFLSYYFGQESFKEYIRMVAVGATMPSINTQILSEANVIIPPLPAQEGIAEVLSSLDDKIDLLHRNNKTLEQLAETLFRQWFVEEADDTWEVGKVLDLFVLQRGHDLPTQNRREGKYPIVTSSGINDYHDEFKVKGPGVTTGRSGMIGNVYYIPDDFWPLNTSLFIKEYRIATPLFAYFYLKTLDLTSLNAGSAVPTLNRNDVHEIEVLLPKVDGVRKFEETVKDNFRKIQANGIQIRQLETLRDTLLPKLMSGSIKVQNYSIYESET